MLIAASGDELFFREGDAAEDFARVFGAAAGGVAAFLGGDAVIQHRNHQLGISLQADQGELPKSDEQATLFVAQHQFFVKILPNTLGNLGCQFLTGAVADLPHLGAEYHGIQNLYHGGGAVGAGTAGSIRGTEPGIGGENVGAAVFTAQNRPLGEAGKTVKGGGTIAAHHGICQNSIVEGYVDTIMVPVKSHRLHIDVGVQQLGATNPYAGGRIQRALRAFCQIDTKIFNAVLIPAAVGDFSGVDGEGVPRAIGLSAYVLTTF